MTEKEQLFVNSIKNKIEKYSIPVTLKEAVLQGKNTFISTTYNNDKSEIVDIGIERYLCSKSAYYFISNYAWIDFPGVGIIPFNLYYFQEEVLKTVDDLKKLVFLKTRQCFPEDTFVNTNKGTISIKDVKKDDLVETLVNDKPTFVKVLDSFYQGEKELLYIKTELFEIKCTLDHRIYTTKGWIEAKDLTLNDLIVSKLDNQRIISINKLEGIHKVYDITTETSDFLANNLLVHNCGISTVFSLYCFWRGNFKDAESIDVVSIKQSKARAFVAKMDQTIKRIPDFLKTEITHKNTEVIKWANGSQILSESASPKAGRGDSLSLLIMDEAAFYQSDALTRGIVSAAQPTLTRTGGSQIIISTPNGTVGSGSYYYEQVSQLQVDGNDKDNKLVEIDWFEIPDMPKIYPKKGYNDVLNKFIKQDYFNNKNIRLKMKSFFNDITEKFTENEWLKKQYKDLGKVLFKQEILHDFTISGDQVFEEEVLESFLNTIKPPIVEDKIGKIRVNGLWIWKHPTPKHRYILGIDVSKGTSNDFSSIQVMDVDNYEQVAEYKAKIGTKMFGRLIRLVANYYNQGYVVIEANGIGEAVFNEVYYHDTEPYTNVYKQKIVKEGRTLMTGWNTNVKTRQLMLNNLIDWFTLDELRNEIKTYSKRLYLELTTWIWKNGRPDHESNGHDDGIIGFALCLYLRNKATSFGDSFFISEKGDFVESGGTKGLNGEEVSDNGFSVVLSEEDKTDTIQDLYNCNVDEYNWLIGPME